MNATIEVAPPKRRANGMTAARITGWAVLGLWIALGLTLVWKLTTGFDLEFFAKYMPKLLGVDCAPFSWRCGPEGLVMTLVLSGLVMAFAFALALPMAFARMSRNKLVSSFAYGYVYLFRGTPLLNQLFLIYYGSGQFRPVFETLNLWWFFRDAFYCAVFAFTLNEIAYLAEILRGAIEGVPKGQREAAKSLGLSKTVTFWKIIAPQAMIIALRPVGNEIIYTIKASALASVVTVFDLMGMTRLAFARSFNFDIYLWAALIYFAIVEVLRRVWDKVEERLTSHIGYRTSK